MVDAVQLERVLAPISAWARLRSDILGLALVGSWARATARPDSDIDLILLVSEPHLFRRDEHWLAEICWSEGHVAVWRDADYGLAWSRHVELAPLADIEFTFCEPSWAATNPIEAGTVNAVSGGCRILVDKANLFANLLTAVLP